MIKKLIIPVVLVVISCTLNAQEYLTGIYINSKLLPKNLEQINVIKQATEAKLPFVDDFSGVKSVFPSDTLWEDRDVFINSGYSINPPSLGVATFDVLNDTGAVYPNATTTPFISDVLTSLPIRLDSLFNGTPTAITAADSIYFSFYYQPQGNADAPETDDSLVLEFYSPHLDEWNTIWASQGMKLDTFLTKYNTYFKQVMIPITDTTYIQKGFKFRFKNYASIAPFSMPSWQSNADQWNVDYVYLNTERSKNDTVFADVTFVDKAPAILKNYQQMPIRQFNDSELTDTLHLKISNLNNVLDNISCQYVVNEIGGAFTYTKSGGVWDILPFITNGYHNYQLHTSPVVDFSLPSLAGMEKTAFSITHMLSSNGWTDEILLNDTVRYIQEFNNYFAYDDGSAENGYGLSGENSKLAYKFNLNQPDTLGGVQIYFNQTYSSTASKYFNLMVWSSLNPETLVYKSPQKQPVITDSINEYCTYVFSDTTLLIEGTFYVGWQQVTDNNLNVGFDRNNNAKTNMFYNVGGSWVNSSFNGALMIRPLLGKKWQQYLSVHENPEKDLHFSIYPNPASTRIVNITLPSDYSDNSGQLTIEVFDFLGRNIFNVPFTRQLNVSDLVKGVYMIRLSDNNTKKVFTEKLVITR
ncbi:MAG: T9SS type A sorting domain-containing protein [Bacteroidales bacterium]|nr:T9SS type A sorting domain-containing protein [Bacteroidales bacterium]MDD4213613.1 T9SS type A sorting domain-containing protein [Bacteroidales bacterium]